jgi:hypothetical protein
MVQDLGGPVAGSSQWYAGVHWHATGGDWAALARRQRPATMVNPDALAARVVSRDLSRPGMR